MRSITAFYVDTLSSQIIKCTTISCILKVSAIHMQFKNHDNDCLSVRTDFALAIYAYKITSFDTPNHGNIRCNNPEYRGSLCSHDIAALVATKSPFRTVDYLYNVCKFLDLVFFLKHCSKYDRVSSCISYFFCPLCVLYAASNY